MYTIRIMVYWYDFFYVCAKLVMITAKKHREGERVDSERCERPPFIRAKTQEGEIKKKSVVNCREFGALA